MDGGPSNMSPPGDEEEVDLYSEISSVGVETVNCLLT